jgi:hypothetical protein
MQSAVVIAMGYELDSPDSIPGNSLFFFSSPYRPDRLCLDGIVLKN